MKHILVIDDGIYIGNLLQEALEAEGCRVSRAYSGTEAVLASFYGALMEGGITPRVSPRGMSKGGWP